METDKKSEVSTFVGNPVYTLIIKISFSMLRLQCPSYYFIGLDTKDVYCLRLFNMNKYGTNNVKFHIAFRFQLALNVFTV